VQRAEIRILAQEKTGFHHAGIAERAIKPARALKTSLIFLSGSTRKQG
jgi:hypothetical protein